MKIMVPLAYLTTYSFPMPGTPRDGLTVDDSYTLMSYGLIMLLKAVFLDLNPEKLSAHRTITSITRVLAQ